MAKTLKVIDSFFVVEVGDLFTLSEDGSCYVFQRNEEFHKAGDESELNSAYNSTFTISTSYAQQLIKDGYLEEVVEKAETKPFVNVFDEIDKLIEKYKNELLNLDKDLKDSPMCVRVEKTTVLTNILSVLDHLKNLRK